MTWLTSMRRHAGLRAVVAVLAVASLTDCTGHGRGSHTAASAPAEPAGWTRFSYGSVSVSVPGPWTIVTSPPPSCSPPSDETVTEVRLSSVTESACPANIGRGTVRAVVIECLVGRAHALFSGGPVIRVVNGQALRQGGDGIYLQQAEAEGVVSLATGFASESLGNQILASVTPTGKSC
jgi:hypothetical protein